MWDFLKNAAGKIVQGSAEYIQNRIFIQQLLKMQQTDALQALQAKVQSLDDRGYDSFIGAIILMMQEAQASGQMLQSSGSSSSSWGDSYEDQLYSTIAHIGEGPQAPSPVQMWGMQQLQAYMNSLQMIAAYAAQFRALPRSAAEISPPAAPISTPTTNSAIASPHTESPHSAELKQRLANMMEQGAEMSAMIPLLQEIYQAEIREGTISPERKLQLDGVLGKFEELSEDKSDGLDGLMTQASSARELAADITPLVADPSLPKKDASLPPTARAIRTAEILKTLKTQLMNESTQTPLAPQEQKTWEQLFANTVNLQNGLANVRSNGDAYKLEREALRPLALKMQEFFLRKHLLLTIPYFPTQPVTPDPNAVFFSGSIDLQQLVVQICETQLLSLQPEIVSENPAQQRWNQLRACAIAIFDFRQYSYEVTYTNNPKIASEIAAIAYELGIAFSIGKPVVIVTKQGQALPFDVDIAPVQLNGDAQDLDLLQGAMEAALYGRQRGGEDSSIASTIAILRRQYGSSSNTYVRTALTTLDAQAENDPIKTRHVTSEILRFIGNNAPQMIFPAWPGDYPQARERFCFHVTAFENPSRRWPETTKQIVKAACPKNITYKRGDQSQERDIIRAIWHDICRAWFIVVDLTDLNPNAVLELGMAHVLGRKTFIITQDKNMSLYPATIAKERKFVYSLTSVNAMEELRKTLSTFLATG